MNSQPSFIAAFSAIVEKHASKAAILRDGECALTYRELFDSATACGARLARSGVGRETVVGLCLEKSPEYIVAMLGVWFCGGAFLPLDPALPRERLAFIARDASLRHVVGSPKYRDCFSGLGVAFQTIDEMLRRQKWGRHSCLPAPTDRNVCPTFNADDLAYVIYTSGSTGAPKGVLVTHRGIVNFISAQIIAFELDADSRALFYLSIGFDASISDIGTALLSGATLCIESPAALQPGAAFLAMLRERRITHMDIPPVLLRVLNPSDMPATLKTIVIGGEACAPEIVRAWARRFRVVNVYGPTEATVCTSLCVCDANWERPLIGAPLPGIDYFLLDENLNPAVNNSPAELFMGGASLARGYLNRPDLDAEKFIEWRGRRLYRTGDRVRQASGGIEFLGRIDRQFKWRGQLTEPAEIEACLQRQPDVRRAAVLKRKLRPESQRDSLVAFVEPITSDSLSAGILNAHVSRALPRWMWPRRYEFLRAMPLSASGKVDFAALEKWPLTPSRGAERLSEPLSEIGALLREIWLDVLGLESAGMQEDFFELGGDSMNVLEVSAAAEARGLTLPPALISARRTLAGVLAALEGNGAGSHDCMRSEDLLRDIEALAPAKLDDAPAVGGRPPEGGTPNFFLTGATGLLGSHLLSAMLSETTAIVYCLVRADDDAHALQRIQSALQRNPSPPHDSFRARIVPVRGDVGQIQFGLRDDEWSRLAAAIDGVYHCAADLNLLASYRELRSANVEGTAEVLRFLHNGKRKCLHYASTLSVFVASDLNRGKLLESDHLERACRVYGGYAQSKWAAEALLRSVESAAAPISYYRFGLLAGDSSGPAAPSYLALFIRGLAALGCVPRDRPEIRIDLTPVDFAARAMLRLSMRGFARNGFGTYHIANPRSTTFEEVLESLRGMGVAIADVSRGEFMRRMSECGAPESSAALALCRCLSNSEEFESRRSMDLFQSTDVVVDMERTLADLAGSGIECPAPLRDLLQGYWKSILNS